MQISVLPEKPRHNSIVATVINNIEKTVSNVWEKVSY